MRLMNFLPKPPMSPKPRSRLRNAGILHRYLFRHFLLFFTASLALFALLLELVDLFSNLWRFLSLGAPLGSIMLTVLYFLPAAISNALPIAMLFAAAYSLGSLYSDNELTVVFCSGISLFHFVTPLLLAGLLFSAASIWFNDRVVLPSTKQKNELTRQLIHQRPSQSQSNVAVIAQDGRIVYKADYYDDSAKALSLLTIIERDADGEPLARTDASLAHWDGGSWRLTQVRRFTRDASGAWIETAYGSWSAPGIDEPPESFKGLSNELDEMSVEELDRYVRFMKRAGLPFAEGLAEKHKRFSFAFAPFIVVLLAGAIGGSFRKNVLLMCLLASLATATVYYVAQMLFMLMAKSGMMEPRLGAWAPFVVFAALGLFLFRRART